jgi:hypothetical protein
MRNSIQPAKLKKIAEVYPDLNSTWLLTGDGEMINKPNVLQAYSHDLLVKSGSEIFKDKLIEMFKNGEIYSASVVVELNKNISELNRQLMKLEDENQKLRDENSMLKK